MKRELVTLGYYDRKGFFQYENTVNRVISSKKKLVRYKNKRYIVVNPDWNYAILEVSTVSKKRFQSSYNSEYREYNLIP